MKKISYQILDSPDGVHAWVNEELIDTRYSSSAPDSKLNMDSLDTFFSDLPTSSSTLEELKPLDPIPVDYLTASPDTSGARHELSPISSTSPNQYKGAITNNNTFFGYGTPSEQVSTTTSPLPSTVSIPAVKQEPPSYIIPHDIDDIATMLGSAISENLNNNTLVGGMTLSDTFNPLNSPDLDIEAWIESMSSVKHEPMDSFIHSTVPASPIQGATQVHQPSTTTNIISTTITDYDSIHESQTPLPSSTPMLQSLLASDTVNTTYTTTLEIDPYQKNEVSMPILQACLEGLKEIGNSGQTFINGNGITLKADPMFNRSPYYSSKDCIPHSTDPTTYAVTTTDDLLIRKYDSRSYLDKTQLPSPESTDLSSTKIGLEFGEIKGKGRNRIKNSKPPIRTEGTKDKPVHYCSVCHRAFINKSNIKVHLRTHTGEKPFKCETCNKPFRQKAHLLKHYQIHRRGEF